MDPAAVEDEDAEARSPLADVRSASPPPPPPALPDADDSQSVKVAVRIRPFLARERADRSTSCVTVLSESEIIMGAEGAQRQFTFDQVLDEEATQELVYTTCVRCAVPLRALAYACARRR